MNNQNNYVDPIAAKLVELFELHANKDLKRRYYFGTPMIIAQNQLNFFAAHAELTGNIHIRHVGFRHRADQAVAFQRRGC